MLPFTIPSTTAAEELAHLEQLRAERTRAHLAGDAPLVEDLDAEILAVAGTYVAVAVTEIATLRAELGGRPQG